MQHLDKTLATYVRNNWNIWNIHLQHTCIAIATYATPIYFCNIHIKHVQHTYETHETYGCNMCSSTCCCPMKARWRSTGERSMRRGRREARAGCATRGRSGEVWGVGARGARRVRPGGIGRSRWIGKRSVQIFLRSGEAVRGVGPVRSSWQDDAR